MGVEDLDARIGLQARAVRGGEVARELAAGLEGDVERLALDPALHLARAQLQAGGGSCDFDGNAEG